MTDDELKAIRERLEKATPGDWESTSTHCVMIGSDEDAILIADVWGKNADADGDFIAHAPADIAALLAEVERLQEKCEQLYYEGLEE